MFTFAGKLIPMKREYSIPRILVVEADAFTVICASGGSNVTPGGIEELEYGEI